MTNPAADWVRGSLFESVVPPKPPPLLGHDAGIGRDYLIAEVDDNGRCRIAMDLARSMRPKDALALASWIVETFGPRPAVPDVPT